MAILLVILFAFGGYPPSKWETQPRSRASRPATPHAEVRCGINATAREFPQPGRDALPEATLHLTCLRRVGSRASSDGNAKDNRILHRLAPSGKREGRQFRLTEEVTHDTVVSAGAPPSQVRCVDLDYNLTVSLEGVRPLASLYPICVEAMMTNMTISSEKVRPQVLSTIDLTILTMVSIRGPLARRDELHSAQANPAECSSDGRQFSPGRRRAH